MKLLAHRYLDWDSKLGTL